MATRTQETKLLLGGMDKDNSIESIHQYDYIDAHNVRSTGVEGSDAGYTTNIEGTQLISTNLPTGSNKGIGGARFETIGKAYRIVYNSGGKHQIRELDYKTNLESVVFENLTDSGGVDILNITANTFYSDVRLMHEKFLILNNGESYPLFINVEEFKSNKGLVTYSKEDLLLPKIPPTKPIKVKYLSDPNKSTNSLRGNLFQFRYNYEYSDFRTTTWSTISKREVPINEPSEGNGQNVSSNNVMLLTVDLSHPNIEKVNIAVRIGLGNWLLVSTSDLERIKALPNVPIGYNVNTGELTEDGVSEAYNPTTKEYQFLFYNEGLYPILDQQEVNNPYDKIPLKAETLEVVNGNVLAIGGLTDGYDRPILEKVDDYNVGTEVSYYNPNLKNKVETKPNFDVSRVDYTWHYKNIFSSKTVERWYIYFNDNPPQQGDKIILKLKYTSPIEVKLEYVVTSSDELSGKNITIQNAVNSFIGQLPSDSYIRTGDNGSMMYRKEADGKYRLTAHYVEYAETSKYSTQSVNTLKNGATYQVAISYFDKFGMYFPIVTDSRFIATSNSISETEGLLPEINWNLPIKAPVGAVGYNILLSENQTYQNYITLTGTKETVDNNYLTINLKSLAKFNESEKESQVNYDFTKGDKVTFIRTINEDGQTVEWFRFPFIELDIVDFEIDVDQSTQETKYLLKVRYTPLLDNYNFTDKEIVLELYTPKAKAINEESTFFYEIGETYPIVDGEHSQTSGIIRTGDSYYRGRLYRSSLDINNSTLIEVADPNFSDNYESRYWSAGRARTYNDEVGRVELKASIRYSDEYNIGSKYNGVNRFYLERIYGEKGGETTSKYGAIKRLEMRNNALVCVQEFKVGIIPVYTSIIYDQSGQNQVAISDRLFNPIQYRQGNYGCGTAKESVAVSRDSVIYFIDNNNCVPVRDSLSGLDVIDGNLTHYFIEHIQTAKTNNSKLIGYYDDLNEEYNITTQEYQTQTTTLSYTNSVYTDQTSIDYNAITDLVTTNGIVTRSGKDVTFTPNEDYTGSAVISFKHKGVSKIINVSVQAGDVTPDEFSFVPKTNQQLSTLVESNEITVSGFNTRSPISIVGGEYSINGGIWTSASGFILPDDSVKVRLITSGTKDTVKSATLTIGGVDGIFSTTTIPNSVTPNEFFNVNFTITQPSPQTGSQNSYGVKVELSHILSVDYTCLVRLQYPSFGSQVLSAEHQITVEAGDTEYSTSWIVTNADPVEEAVVGRLVYSDVYQGDTIVTADTVSRIVTSPTINEEFYI